MVQLWHRLFFGNSTSSVEANTLILNVADSWETISTILHFIIIIIIIIIITIIIIINTIIIIIIVFFVLSYFK